MVSDALAPESLVCVERLQAPLLRNIRGWQRASMELPRCSEAKDVSAGFKGISEVDAHGRQAAAYFARPSCSLAARARHAWV